MFQSSDVYASFSVDDLDEAYEFYSEVLKLVVDQNDMGLWLKFPGAGQVFIYEKEDHLPATYTVLNFEVDDIDEAVQILSDEHVVFERYEGLTDEDNISRGIDNHTGPDIAWFKDPAGNILSVLQTEHLSKPVNFV